MHEPSDLGITRASYDTVAADYAELLSTELAGKPLDRALPATFAELVQATGGGPVADLGCGPGRVTAHLLLAFKVGDERVHLAQAYGHPVSLDVYRFSPDRVADQLGEAGLVVHARLVREPDESEATQQAYLMARKPRRCSGRGDDP